MKGSVPPRGEGEREPRGEATAPTFSSRPWGGGSRSFRLGSSWALFPVTHSHPAPWFGVSVLEAGSDHLNRSGTIISSFDRVPTLTLCPYNTPFSGLSDLTWKEPPPGI